MHKELPFEALKRFSVNNNIVKQMFAEFIGTLILITMADSAAASYILKGHGSPVDGFGASFAAGIGLFIAVLVSAAISGGHINPMVTFGLTTVRKCSWKIAPLIMFAQYLGAFLGSALVFANNYNSIVAYDYGKRSAFGNDTSTGGIFTTYPGEHVTAGGALLDQTICAGILMFTIMGLTDNKNLNIPPILVPVSLGITLCALSVAFGLNCGAALNPARDLSGRIFTSMAGYGSKVWDPLDGFYWWIGGVIGPYLGGAVGAWIYFMLIELHHQMASAL